MFEERRFGGTRSVLPPGRQSICRSSSKCSNLVRRPGLIIQKGRARRMSKRNLPQKQPKPLTLVYWAMTFLSVAAAITAAELITRLLHAEAIASVLLCAVIVCAWLGGFGPACLAIALALLAFHYYLLSPINSFTWKNPLFLFDVGVAEVPRLVLFSI